MHCPKCHATIGPARSAAMPDPFWGFPYPVRALLREMAYRALVTEQDRCPHCAARIYVVDTWRWPRGFACGVPAILLNYRWYPMECNIARLLIWSGVVMTVYLLLWIISTRLLPLRFDLVPQDGPIRLDL
jgi:hypothetical protein